AAYGPRVEGPDPADTLTNSGSRRAAPPGNLYKKAGQRPTIHRLHRCRGPRTAPGLQTPQQQRALPGMIKLAPTWLATRTHTVTISGVTGATIRNAWKLLTSSRRATGKKENLGPGKAPAAQEKTTG
ncbi:hypothetical protein BO94DRAFT_480490, partial [Aspergillus sclerotioniger CBS 115572]